MDQSTTVKTARLAAIVLGVGLGGFVDGILLHQILQWHNMLSSVLPPETMQNMRINMTWDGFFNAGDWLLTVVGVFMLWHVARQGIKLPSMRWFSGWLILGWGLFNLVEGLLDHHLLGIHHVKYEPTPYSPSLAWDLGFIVVGGVGLIVLGWAVSRQGSTLDSTP